MTMTTGRSNGEIEIAAGSQLVAGGPELELHAAVRRAVESGCRRLVLELGSVSAIDAAGVGAIAAAAALAREHGVSLVIADPSPRVTTLLSITGIARVITIADRRTARRVAPGLCDRRPHARPSGS